jgi:hypothetical protein
MKRIILSVIVMAFAVAVQAGDAKTSQDKDKAGCSGCKVKTSVQAKEATSSTAKSGCGCCKMKAPVKQTGLPSPKAADAAK